MVFPDHKVVIRAEKEPQSEAEESKVLNNFKKEVTKQCDLFLQALENFEIVQ